jgi:hypothetical protein
VIDVSEISYRVGSPPTAADRKHHKHHRGWGFWLDFILSGVWEFTMITSFMLFILTA